MILLGVGVVVTYMLLNVDVGGGYIYVSTENLEVLYRSKWVE